MSSAVEQVTQPARVPAVDGRPEGDQYWQGYAPMARTRVDGRDPAALAAELLQGTAPVSHPAWCCWELCDVWDHGAVMHVADVGADPDPGSSWIAVIRPDYWDEDDQRWHHEQVDLFEAPQPIPDSLITKRSRARILPVI